MKKDAPWQWNHEHQNAFRRMQEACCEPPVLKYYDAVNPVTISADSSQSGLGAVCLQEGQPVAHASRALTTTQQAYAQIEKEMLAIVFACEKFHKPLIYIFKKPLHECPARLQRMLLRLQQYKFDVCYKRGKDVHITLKKDDKFFKYVTIATIFPLAGISFKNWDTPINHVLLF